MGLDHLTGFGNEHQTEAVPGVLPQGQNSPQRVARGLYAEQLSGTAFTMPRAANRRTWMYRVRPSVRHVVGLREIDTGRWATAPIDGARAPVGQLRWDPFTIDATAESTFVSGLATVAGGGQSSLAAGATAHIYCATASMIDEVLVVADGELLIVPQQGGLRLVTELGVLEIEPGEIAVVPRAVKFRVELTGGAARGYVCENHGAEFVLPEPGIVGTNALAMPRDFRYPVAAYEDDRPTRLVMRYDGRLFETMLEHTPLDVVAWHGNHAPYAYDLRNYCPIGPVLFDHPDPSIWTVLTSPSDTPGVANIDFVLFRDRWSVSEHTFRPPWYHRNVMSELMGLIDGAYDARGAGFAPGGLSIHNAFLPHGPDAQAFAEASAADLTPERLSGMLAFMFESRYKWVPTEWATGLAELQGDYTDCWAPLGRTTDL